jgi:hypothetical protein
MFGRRPRDITRYAPTFETYMWQAGSGLQPVPMTTEVDRALQVPAWPVYGNDLWGDCTCAAIGHMIQAWSAYAGHKFAALADDQVLDLYSAVAGFDRSAGPSGANPTDQGATLQSVLRYMWKTGVTGPDGHLHKLAGYASLGNPHDEVLLGTALSVFGSVYVGVNLQQAQQAQFGQVWEYEAGSKFEGGHAICLQRRSVNVHGILDYVTWGRLQPSTRSFQRYCADEAWVAVTEDWLTDNGTTVEGMDLATLLADMAYVK